MSSSVIDFVKMRRVSVLLTKGFGGDRLGAGPHVNLDTLLESEKVDLFFLATSFFNPLHLRNEPKDEEDFVRRIGECHGGFYQEHDPDPQGHNFALGEPNKKPPDIGSAAPCICDLGET